VLVILALRQLDSREGSPVLCFELIEPIAVGHGESKIIRTFGNGLFSIIHSARVCHGIPF